MKVQIPENVFITQDQLQFLLSTYSIDCVEDQLERYAEWKVGKSINSDIACFKKFFSNMSKDSKPVTVEAKGKTKDKPSFYFRKERDWVLIEKYRDYEIIHADDFCLAYTNALSQTQWSGDDLPVESVFINPDFLPLFIEGWDIISATGEVPDEWYTNRFWVWAKDPDSPVRMKKATPRNVIRKQNSWDDL